MSKYNLTTAVPLGVAAGICVGPLLKPHGGVVLSKHFKGSGAIISHHPSLVSWVQHSARAAGNRAPCRGSHPQGQVTQIRWDLQGMVASSSLQSAHRSSLLGPIEQ
jgi:hypothetical protein